MPFWEAKIGLKLYAGRRLGGHFWRIVSCFGANWQADFGQKKSTLVVS